MTVAGGAFAFRHALLREAVYDDLLPGERVDLHLALARLLEQGEPASDEREVERATMVASHYASAGDQPAALRATVRAALAARKVHAYGEAADLAERALELWPRVPDEEKTFDLDHVGLLLLAAGAHCVADDRARTEVLFESALEELDPERDPRRYASVLARLADTQWQLNRGLGRRRDGAARAGLCCPTARATSGPRCWRWLARTRFLRGRFRDAETDGEEALALAVAVGDRDAEIDVLNTLGMTQIALGEVEEGVARLRRAIEIAREIDNVDGLAFAYSNLADMLNLRGRTREAIETMKEGLAAVPRRLPTAATG